MTVEELSRFRGDNAISDRAIKQSKLAQSKKDAIKKEKNEERNELHEKIELLNQDIFDKCWKLDQETRRFKNPSLLKDVTEETMKYR